MAMLDESDQSFPLWLRVRYAICAPLIWLDGSAASSFLQGLYLLIYSLPVVLWTPQGSSRRSLQLIFLFIPILVSFRLAISIYAVLFFMMFLLDKRLSRWMLLWFSFPMMLSTSTMFVYALAFPFLARSCLRGANIINILLWIVYFSVVGQFMSKIFDLFNRSLDGEVLSTAQNVGLDYSGSSINFFLSLLTGNPFYSAIVSGQYDRLIYFASSIFFLLFIVIRLLRSRNYGLIRYILILLASMLSEGVGAYALSIVLFMLILHSNAILAPRCSSFASLGSLRGSR